jgi:hypothetical protein
VNLLKLPSTPPTLTNPARLASGVFHFTFASSPDAPFSVLATTNIVLPLTNWAPIGSPTQSSSGFFEFTDQQLTSERQRFYRVRSP